MPTKTLGQQIRAARESVGLSRRRLGIILDCEGSSIYNWERGKHNPDLGTLQAIAKATGHVYRPPEIVPKDPKPEEPKP